MGLKKKLLPLVTASALLLSVSTTALGAIGDTGFADVNAGTWYTEAVQYVRDNGLMSGTSATTFDPDGTMTRAMLSVVLYRIAGSPSVSGTDSFTDTNDNTWYSNAVLWASRQDLVSGYGNGLFGTNDPVTREQIATILWRYAGRPSAAAGTDFADESSISGYASTAVDWARANGIINGIGNNRFAPRNSATRAQVAVILMNYRKLGQDVPDDDPAKGGKALVAYFTFAENIGDTSDMTVDAIASASLGTSSGNTMGNLPYMAQIIQETTGADVHHIQVEQPYNRDYNVMRTRAYEELDNNILPALQTQVEDLDQYDVIYLGTPVWAGQMPPAVASFLTANDLSGKKIIPFGIHMGSGFGSILRRIDELCPNASRLEGLTVNARTSNTEARAETLRWLTTLDMDQ